jgi:hypothetical protein
MIRLVLIVFYLEVGLVLTVVPWSIYWERNYFGDLLPLLHAIMTNDFFRGAVSGLGIVNLAAAASELRSLLASRRAHGRRLVAIHQSPVIEE